MDKVEGFDYQESEFMEYVPSFLQTFSMTHIADLYNQTFGTDLSTDEFHDRFDDYMQSSHRVLAGNQEIPDIVKEFLKDHPSVADNDESVKVLSKYEHWCRCKDLETVQSVSSQIRSFNTIVKNMVDNLFSDHPFI